MKVITAENSRRIAKFAFDYATKHGRKKVYFSAIKTRLFYKNFHFLNIIYRNRYTKLYSTAIMPNCIFVRGANTIAQSKKMSSLITSAAE